MGFFKQRTIPGVGQKAEVTLSSTYQGHDTSHPDLAVSQQLPTEMRCDLAQGVTRTHGTWKLLLAERLQHLVGDVGFFAGISDTAVDDKVIAVCFRHGCHRLVDAILQ